MIHETRKISQTGRLVIGSETTQFPSGAALARQWEGQMGQYEAELLGFTADKPYLATMHSDLSRRYFMKYGAAAATLAASGTAFADSIDDGVSTRLMRQAMTALAQHGKRIVHTDRIGIVDSSRPSSSARFTIVDVGQGTSQCHLVAHGRGSDPSHTGWASRFSNEPGSYASSIGAFVTGSEYSGHHGRSMRLAGLDPANCNAESRTIVVHAAWYVTPEIASRTGMLGRSEGCFAVSTHSLDYVIDQLGPGRLLYAGKA